jgi:hypothetical protein
MRRGGIRGIRDILNTGIILSDSILNGADTRLVGTMTRIFIIGTIVARGEVGIKDSMAFVPKEPPVLAVMALQQPVMEFIALEQPLLAVMALQQPVMEFMALEQPLLAVMDLQQPVMEFIALEQPIMEFALR